MMIELDGVYLVILLFAVYFVDIEEKLCLFRKKELVRFFPLFFIIIFNSFFILNDNVKFWSVLDIFSVFPKFIEGDLNRSLFLMLLSIFNTVFISYYSRLNEKIYKAKNNYEFLAFVIRFKWAFLVVINAIIIPTFVAKWSIVFSSDIMSITNVDYDNFPFFDVILRVFIVMYYITFLSIFAGVLIVIFFSGLKFIGGKDYKVGLILYFTVVVSFMIWPAYHHILLNDVFDKKVMHILIETSYNKNNARCKDLIDSISQKEEVKFEYSLFISSNDVSLVSKIDNRTEMVYIFAVGNCVDKSYQIVSK